MPDIRIATRKSELALWQANEVRRLLQLHHPGLRAELVEISTEADRVLDRPLALIGGKGLFVKALELALLEDRADIAVHSLKDVPSKLDDGFELAAFLESADPRDVVVAPGIASLDALPAGARVGSSSLRRQMQLKKLRPDLAVEPVRGNVNTRLAKLDAGEFDALVLAAAGLERLNLSERIDIWLSPEQSLPAAGQGVIAVECLQTYPHRGWLVPVDVAASRRRAAAERQVCKRLDASCSIPLAAYARERRGEIMLRSRLGSLSGEILEADARDGDPVRAGDRVADALFDAGAARILREFEQEVNS